jgi:outer membrane protein OmpA-like peptidoglycan-associated protein
MPRHHHSHHHSHRHSHRLLQPYQYWLAVQIVAASSVIFLGIFSAQSLPLAAAAMQVLQQRNPATKPAKPRSQPNPQRSEIVKKSDRAGADRAALPTWLPWRIGVGGAFGRTTHAIDCAELPARPLFAPRTAANLGPPNLQQSTASNGFSLWLDADYALSGMSSDILNATQPSLLLGLRVGYSALDGTAETRETYPVGRTNGMVTEAGSLYTVSTTLRQGFVEPYCLYKPLPAEFGLFLRAGARLGIWLQAAYSQRETLFFSTTVPNAPTTGGFTPRTFEQVRAESSGSIGAGSSSGSGSNRGLQASAVLAAGWEFPFDIGAAARIVIAPEVAYCLAFTDITQGLKRVGIDGLVDGGTWKAHQLSLGATLKVQFGNAAQSEAAPDVAPDVAPEAAPILAGSPTEQKTNIISPKPLPEAVTPITPKPAPILVPQLELAARNADGTERSEVIILQKKLLATKSLCPILPYVFFDNEANIRVPDRYALLTPRQVAAFDPTKLNDGEVLFPNEHVYYHILNVVAERMKRYPKAVLTLTGCVDGASLGERGRMEIARARAAVLKEYLLEAWGKAANISPARIRTEVKGEGIPLKASIPLDVRSNMVENRRVELQSDTPEILAPLLLQSVRSAEERPQLVVRPNVSLGSESSNGSEPSNSRSNSSSSAASEAVKISGAAQASDIQRWQILVRAAASENAMTNTAKNTTQNTTNSPVLKQWSGVGAVPKELVWDLNDGLNDDAQTAPPALFDVELSVTDARGRTANTHQTLPVRVRRDEREDSSTPSSANRELQPAALERYRLILFDYNSSDLTQSHRATIDLVKKSLQSSLERSQQPPAGEPSIFVTGYTDRVGNEDGNKRLSLARARSTADALGLLTKDAGAENSRGNSQEKSRAFITGNGSTPLLYDNDVPEGRFYCRTVIVQIQQK